MDRVNLGIVIESFFHLPFWAGVQNGWYREQGLDVTLSVMGGIDETTRALKDRTIDIGVGSPEHVIQDVEAGGDLRIVGGSVNRLTHHLIVQPEITSLEQLRGKILGVSALTGGTSSLFIDILERVGLTPEDYTIVVAGTVPPRHIKLQRREIDAGMQTDPHNYIADDAGFGNLGLVSQWIPYFIFNSINARREWATAHSSILTRFLLATIKASHWMLADRAGAVDLASDWMGIARGYADRSWKEHVAGDAVPLDLHVKRASIDTTVAMMRRDRSMAIAADARPEKYVELTFLEAAQAQAGAAANLLPDH